MNFLRIFLSRIRSVFQERKLDADLDEELRIHIDLAIAENMTLGMNRQQARTKAMRDFGGLTQTRETYRIRRGFPVLEQLARDLRFGLRQLYRAPGFALTAILTLALGLGANTAIFSLVNALLLRPLAVSNAEQLTIISTTDDTDLDSGSYYLCYPMLRALETRPDLFQQVAASGDRSLLVRGAAGTQKVSGLLVSGQFFQALETPPLLGRYLLPSDDVHNGSPAGYGAVISEGFWNSWFNRAPNVVGSKLVIENVPFTVVGVMPGQFFGVNPTKRPNIYVPLSAEPAISAPYSSLDSGYSAYWLQLIGRRQQNISLQQMNAALRPWSLPAFEATGADAGFMKRARADHTHFAAESGSRGYTYFREFFKKPLIVVFCLCGAVLLLACLNLASLLMARATARERELATRLAIGATRGRLVRQLLAETFLIAAIGTSTGLAVSPLVSHALAALLLHHQPDTFLDTSLDLRVFAFAALLTFVAALIIGLVPALRATAGDLNDHIKNGSHSRSARDRHRLLPRVLMSTEVALALMLVIGAGLLAASLTRLYRTGLGFDPKGVMNIDLSMDKQGLKGQALTHWYEAFADTLSHQPGVENVSFDSITPLGGSMEMYYMKSSFSKEDLAINDVGPGYFAAMHIPILQGRDFRWSDTPASGRKIILNQTAAKTLFPDRDAVGQSVRPGGPNPAEVIGVVGDVHYTSIRKPAPAGGFFPITQNADDEIRSYTAVVRFKGPAGPIASAARTIAMRTAPGIPAPVITTMSGTLDDSITSERMMAILAVFFAACALLVTAIGLYGTLAYATARRTSEIGIRMALGAQRTQVVALVFRENTWIAAGGSLAGLVAALLASRVLSTFLYGTSVHDPWVLVGSVAALVLVASAASLIPAVRAARIEPMEALRSE